MTQQPAHRRERYALRVRRAAALVPLSVISVSWTVAVAGSGLSPVPAAGGASAGRGMPAGVSVPDLAVEAPASTSGIVSGAIERPVGVVTVARAPSLIAPPALAAYQRAAAIIDGADSTCGLEWPLLAAIGRVESGHGTANGNRLGDDGVAVPGVVGVALDGSRGTAVISDTDGGVLDGDESWDRAVGPMQFIPSTWAVVGVDADDDGERNPQDVDDAALAAAVHLCSGSEDLSTTAGQRVALLRYNRSSRYADLVLETARSYAATAVVPVSAGLVVSPVRGEVAAPTQRSKGKHKGGAVAAPAPSRADRGPGAAGPVDREPAGPRAGGSGGTEGGGAEDGPGVPPAKPAGPVEAVTGLLTTTEAVLACTLAGLSRLLQPGRFQDCVADRTS